MRIVIFGLLLFVSMSAFSQEKPYGTKQNMPKDGSLSGTIIDADTKATQYTDGDYTSQKYFEMLWEETEDVFVGQRNMAAQDLASLWYTAWINAGQPPIPPLPENISELSIHKQDEPSRIQYSSWIFFILLAISATLVIWKGKKK